MTDGYINTNTCADLLFCPDKYLVPQSGLHEALHLENNEETSELHLLSDFVCVCVCVSVCYL